MIERHLGQSGAAEAAAGGMDYEWWGEFHAQASGLGTTFTPSILGFAAVLENTSGLLDNRPLAAGLAGITLAWLAAWSFLSGGIIDRYARARPTRSAGFFAACGAGFWRILRLGAAAAITYLALFGPVHGWVVEGPSARLAGDFTAERAAFAVRAGGYVVFSMLLAGVAAIFDYARIRLVVEDRRSATAALLAAGRYIGRHARRVGGLILLNASAYLALVLAYGALSRGAARADMPLWLVLGLGQTYIIGRHYLKLLVYASETSLFQGTLAHAAYTAAPAMVWPDSPAVETIANAEPTVAP